MTKEQIEKQAELYYDVMRSLNSFWPEWKFTTEITKDTYRVRVQRDI
jgi:hypothetical protein